MLSRRGKRVKHCQQNSNSDDDEDEYDDDDDNDNNDEDDDKNDPDINQKLVLPAKKSIRLSDTDTTNQLC